VENQQDSKFKILIIPAPGIGKIYRMSVSGNCGETAGCKEAASQASVGLCGRSALLIEKKGYLEYRVENPLLK
jgi:hypothetical protein